MLVPVALLVDYPHRVFPTGAITLFGQRCSTRRSQANQEQCRIWKDAGQPVKRFRVGFNQALNQPKWTLQYGRA